MTEAKRPRPKKREKSKALALIPKPKAAGTKPLFDDEPARSIEEIRKAAFSYLDVREQRQALTPIEVERKEKLAAVMKRHKLRRYHDVEAHLIVEILVTEETVKVRRESSEDDDDK